MAGPLSLPSIHHPTNDGRAPITLPSHPGSGGKTRIGGSNHVTVRTTGGDDFLPQAKQNGYLISGEVTQPTPHLTFYHNEAGSRVRAENAHRPSKRRLQSLPARKPNGDEASPRQVTSAPSKKGHKALAPTPKLNNLMAKLRASDRQNTYGHYRAHDPAGVSTKAHETHAHRSQKFATSWANARAEQANIRNEPSSESKVHAEKKTDDRAHPAETKPEVANDTHPEENKPESAEKTRSEEKPQEEVPNREKERSKRRTEPVLKHIVSPPNSKGNSPREATKTTNMSPYVEWRPRDRSRGKRTWNPSYVVNKPVVLNKRREEMQLTHHPALTDINEVYKAYTGQTRRQLRERAESSSGPESQYGDVYNAELTVSPRNKKEYVLTLREAETYTKMHSVYGNEGERRHRKTLLLQKLVTVEVEQIRLYNKRLRENQQRLNESKRRQELQLYGVRKRFKEQQCRRFRSQYVTGRVLEHEKMNRKTFGLPEEMYEEEYEKVNDEDEDEVRVESSNRSAHSRKKKEMPVRTYNKQKKKKAFEKKYRHMFDIKPGPDWDPRGTPPKMERVEDVPHKTTRRESNVKEKHSEVKDVVKDAKHVLQIPTRDLDAPLGESRGVTPVSRSTRHSRRRPSIDSLDSDDDDEDIFERARRKYNLDVDSK